MLPRAEKDKTRKALPCVQAEGHDKHPHGTENREKQHKRSEHSRAHLLGACQGSLLLGSVRNLTANRYQNLQPGADLWIFMAISFNHHNNRRQVSFFVHITDLETKVEE